MDQPSFDTLVVHAGIEPEATTGAVMTPIFQTSTFAQSAPGVHKGYEYARTDNPTRTVLQTQLAALESAEQAFVFASGMAAVDTTLNLLRQGDHVVACDDLYGGTRRLFTRVAVNRGIDFDFVDLSDVERLRSAIRPETKLVWLESPTNPLLKVLDIGEIAEVARSMGAATVVDNTFMSPCFQRPLELGADIVMHSMTKYINGHSDVVMGALMVAKDAAPKIAERDGFAVHERIKFLQNSMGGVPGPFDSWLVLRGIKTLAIRMQRIESNAGQIAEWLSAHPSVDSVLYPGLTNHPQHELAKRQASGFGGMISFRIRGGEGEARAFLSGLKIFSLAESLGGVESLAELPSVMTHASIPAEIRTQLGITDNLVRLSIGIEGVEDLKSDIDQALLLAVR